MYLSDAWEDYQILDAGDGNKLERWGEFTLLRPDPQAVWPMDEPVQVHARYLRSPTGGGHWEYARPLPDSWPIAYRDLRFIVRPTGFKHTGLFPEQAVNWDWMRAVVARANGRPFRALNLFAYTGGATAALAAAGAEVVHVDAAKGMVAWAKDNLAASGLAERNVRFIVDDVMKFVLREQRRGRLYDGILMDPPSYGRGPGGEMWKIEEGLYPLVAECAKLLQADARFFLINSYTTGLAPAVLGNVLQVALGGRGGRVEAGEVGLPISRGGLVLPCGASGRWER
ncbi:MAG: class I SAM-dependent methyltransferase [Christensenellaceae bacterium]|jgi:23S rRNA (cytosine1962-C5)-methyltransferase|nr:class I SAM-dependent methyltransferase [Christensenellaceae bacterium]